MRRSDTAASLDSGERLEYDTISAWACPMTNVCFGRFTVRQLLIVTTALGVWFGLMSQGHYYFGIWGLTISGIFFGYSLFHGCMLILRWKRYSIASRSRILITIAVATIAGLSLFLNDYAGFMYDNQQQVRQASRLEDRLHQQGRFQQVTISYQRPHNVKGMWTEVRGSVPSEKDLDDLRRIVEGDGTSAVWAVTVSDQDDS